MDSASPQVSKRVVRMLGQNNIMAIVCPAHPKKIFQALDLVFVAGLKKIKQTATGEFDENSIREQVTKLIQADDQTGVGRLDTNILRFDCFWITRSTELTA
jgi:hypothetical protein